MEKEQSLIEQMEFFLPKSFKGLSKKYIIKCIYDKKIQKQWKPKTGDIIVGETGNIFVISGKQLLHDDLGGTIYFFGGSLCNRDGGCILNETHSFTMNKSGKWFTYVDGQIVEQSNPYHSGFYEFKYVPYPHEKYKIIKIIFNFLYRTK